MQTPSPQEVTWAVVALEALKYLGPATLVLIGSLLTMRHQRLLRQKELDAGAKLKARELVFNHYQKKLDKISALTESLGKAMSELEVLQYAPGTGDAGPAATAFMNSIMLIVVTAKHEAEGVEEELRAYGLEKKYAEEIEVVRQLIGKTWKLEGDLKQQLEAIRGVLSSLTLVQEAALEARMKDLFSEYLPQHTLKLNR